MAHRPHSIFHRVRENVQVSLTICAHLTCVQIAKLHHLMHVGQALQVQPVSREVFDALDTNHDGQSPPLVSRDLRSRIDVLIWLYFSKCIKLKWCTGLISREEAVHGIKIMIGKEDVQVRNHLPILVHVSECICLSPHAFWC